MGAIYRLLSLDDAPAVFGNRLLVAASGGSGYDAQRQVLADLRCILWHLTEDPNK